MIDIGYVALDNAQSPALAATNPYSLAKVPEIADQPYGAPRHTWVTKAGTNIDHRLAFPLLSTAASGAKRPPLPERVFDMIIDKYFSYYRFDRLVVKCGATEFPRNTVKEKSSVS